MKICSMLRLLGATKIPLGMLGLCFDRLSDIEFYLGCIFNSWAFETSCLLGASSKNLWTSSIDGAKPKTCTEHQTGRASAPLPDNTICYYTVCYCTACNSGFTLHRLSESTPKCYRTELQWWLRTRDSQNLSQLSLVTPHGIYQVLSGLQLVPHCTPLVYSLVRSLP